MPYYCASKLPEDDSFEHIIHNISPGVCKNLPPPELRIDLGAHNGCAAALSKAKEKFSVQTKVNACLECCKHCCTSEQDSDEDPDADVE